MLDQNKIDQKENWLNYRKRLLFDFGLISEISWAQASDAEFRCTIKHYGSILIKDSIKRELAG